MTTPSVGASPRSDVGEVARRRNRTEATLEELRRVADLDAVDDRWREAAVVAVAGAAAMWERHVTATEAPQGILAEVVEREPRLGHLVRTLRADHAEVRALLDRAGATLPTEGTGSGRDQVRRIAARLAHHHHLGAELIHRAFEVDLGGSD